MGKILSENIRMSFFKDVSFKMFMKREEWLLILLIGIFLFSIVMFFSHKSIFTGNVTESTTSSVVISQYFSIAMSTNLQSGISFGTQTSQGESNVNATSNYDGGSSGSTYYINVSSDSNTAVNFTIAADGPLNTTGGDEIGLGNESYYFSTTTDASNPIVGSEVSLTTSPVAAGSSIAIGTSVYYRFWLDIPAGVAVGTYNNTINFEGVAE